MQHFYNLTLTIKCCRGWDSLRLKLDDLWLGFGERKKIKDIADMFSVSRYTVWRWVKRAYHRGGESFKDKSRRPHTIHRKVTPSVEEAIIILHEFFGWRTRKIKETYRS
jgi:transposase